MSGSFLDKDVPPPSFPLLSPPFRAGEVLSPEFKAAGHSVYLFAPLAGPPDSMKAAWEEFHGLCQSGKVKAAWAVENSLAEAVMKMSFGNRIGFQSGMEDVSWYLPRWAASWPSWPRTSTCPMPAALARPPRSP